MARLLTAFPRLLSKQVQASPDNILEAESCANTIIDGTGSTIIPGIIDSKIDANASISSLHEFAVHGVTTVIDLGSGTIHSEAMRSAFLEIPGSHHILLLVLGWDP